MLVKPELNSIEVLISKALIDSNISYDEFVLINKSTENENQEDVKTKNGRIMLLSKCALCNSDKSKFLKEQESRGLLIKLTGTKVPILSHLFIINTLF